MTGHTNGSGRRAAFVIPHPYVDALACFREPIKALADEGWHVDLYTLVTPTHPVPFFGRENVQLIPMDMSRGGTLSLIRALMTHRPKYRWIVSVPQWGLHVAGLAARLSGIPMACISDELRADAEAATDEERRWKARERRAHQRCQWTIALTEARADFIREENQLGPDHRIFIVPNAPPGRAERLHSRYYQDTLKLPDTTRVLLHSGSLWWDTAHRLIEAAREWTSDWVVVFQGRLAAQANGWRDSARVRLSEQVLPASLMNYATSSASIGLAMYDTTRANNRLMGAASGKVSLYMKNRLPVIATAGSELEWLEREGCGLCVSGVEDIPAAADRIWSEYDRYAANVQRVFDERFDFSRTFASVMTRMNAG